MTTIDAGSRVDTDRLKADLDLVAFAGRYTTLRRTGSVYKGRCPIHDDSTPSFVVYPEQGRGWFCYGCNRGGDVVDLVQELESCDFQTAVDFLSRIVTVHPEDDARMVMPPRVQVRRGEDIREELERAERLADYWARRAAGLRAELAQHPEVLEQLAREGINEAAAAHFGMGYTVHQQARSLVIPWRYQHEGREVVTGVQYRALFGDGFAAGDPRYRWLAGSRGKALFNGQAVLDPVDDTLVIVEGAKKAAALWSHYVMSVTALSSKSAWDPRWAAQLARFARVVFMLDPDAESEAVDAARTVPGSYVARLPMKPDDLLVWTGGDVDLLWSYVEQARKVVA